MFKLAIQEERLTKAPLIPTIKLDNVRKGFFEPDEISRVLEHLPAHLRALINFANSTGWRIGEIKGLTWAGVDFKAGVVRLEPGTTKNDEGRTFPFTEDPRLADVLQQQLSITRELQRQRNCIIPWVFHRDGEPIGRHTKPWKRACELAGCSGMLVHDLRRTVVRRLERAGVSRSVAMKLTGHKTESIYVRYAIVNESDLRAAVTKLTAGRGA
jgi:integrase